MPEDERERAIEAIVASSKHRPRSPRWLWSVALVLGVGCAIAFAVALLRGGDGAASPSTHPATSGGGLTTGVVLGVGVGIAIGWFARGRQSAGADHSSRNRP